MSTAVPTGANSTLKRVGVASQLGLYPKRIRSFYGPNVAFDAIIGVVNGVLLLSIFARLFTKISAAGSQIQWEDGSQPNHPLSPPKGSGVTPQADKECSQSYALR